ncbi:MAG: STAS domain-containing protein [Candidatus Omnitrophota bacterium]|nr:STAS domain-containing protein [Candidatus Omnitrophota bacterium]
MLLKVKHKECRDGIHIIELDGNLDADTNLLFEQKAAPLLAGHPGRLILDMSRLKYIDSMGLASVLRIRKTIEETGGMLAAAGLSPRIREVFKVINVLPEKNIFENMTEIEESFHVA